MHNIWQSLWLNIEELANTCCAETVWLERFSNMYFLITTSCCWIVSVAVILGAMHIVFHLPLHQKKKYLVSLWQAKHLICADWCRQVICRFTHAELQALWKNYIGRIWDLCPSPNAIHVLGCSYWAPPMGTDSCTEHTGNILKRAVKKIEQSSPSREKNRWVGTWQWWPAGGCFW